MKITSYANDKTILKFVKDFEAKSVVVPTSLGVEQTDGTILALAGTPFPSNDAECEGYLLRDYDVTNGAVAGAVVYAGAVDTTKFNYTTEIASAAKSATPRVTFFD